MKIIFCSSNLTIPKTLTLASEQFLIATQSEAIYQFFCSVFPESRVALIDEVKMGMRSPISSLINITVFKNRTKKKFIEFRDCEVYFFSVAFAMNIAYTVKILSANNVIIYDPIVNLPTANPSAKVNIFSDIRWSILSLIYGVPLTKVAYGSRVIFPFSKKFFYAIGAKQREIVVDHKLMADFCGQMLRASSDRQHLLVVGGEVENKVVKKKIFERDLRRILEYIDESRFFVKGRPGFNHPVPLKRFKTLDDSVPGNIYIYRFNVIVGFQSALLFEAANIGKTAVSLIYLIDFPQAEDREFWVEYLVSNLQLGARIEFPKSHEEIGCWV